MQEEVYGPGGVRALGGGDASGTHGEGPTQGCEGQGTCGAHPEHLLHVRDLGRVEDEGLVERRRGLQVETRACNAGSSTGREACEGALGVAATQSACAPGGPDSRLWVRARAERT